MQTTLQVGSILDTAASQSPTGKVRQTVRFVAPKKSAKGTDVSVSQGTTISVVIDDPAQMGQYLPDQLVTLTLTPVAPAAPAAA